MGVWAFVWVVLGGAAVACSDDGASTDSGAGESSGGSWVERAAEQQGDSSRLLRATRRTRLGLRSSSMKSLLAVTYWLDTAHTKRPIWRRWLPTM